MKKEQFYQYLAWFFTLPAVVTLFSFRYNVLKDPYSDPSFVPFRITVSSLIIALLFFILADITDRKKTR